MGFSGDFSPFNSPGRSFGKDLDKLREPLSEASKKSASVAVEAAVGASAAEVVRMLIMRLVQFDKSLPPDQEAVARLFTAGEPFDLLVEDVASLGSNHLVISGEAASGGAAELIISVSQLQFLLFGRRRAHPETEKTERKFHTRHADLFEKLAAKEEAGPAAAPPPATETT